MRQTIKQIQQANRDRGHSLETIAAAGKMLRDYDRLIRDPKRYVCLWRVYPNAVGCYLCRRHYCSDRCPLFGRCSPRSVDPCMSTTAHNLSDHIQYFLEGADADTGVDPKEQARAAARVTKAAKARRTWLVQRLKENGVTVKAAMSTYRTHRQSAKEE